MLFGCHLELEFTAWETLGMRREVCHRFAGETFLFLFGLPMTGLASERCSDNFQPRTQTPHTRQTVSPPDPFLPIDMPVVVFLRSHTGPHGCSGAPRCHWEANQLHLPGLRVPQNGPGTEWFFILIPFLPLTWHLTAGFYKRRLIFVPCHRCYVSWREGIWLRTSCCT